MNKSFNKSGTSINIIVPWEREAASKQKFYQELATAVQMGDIKRYVMRIFDEKEYHRIWPTEDLTRHIQKVIWVIQGQSGAIVKTVTCKTHTHEKNSISDAGTQEHQKIFSNTLPVLILSWRSLRKKNKQVRQPLGINPSNGKLDHSTGYSVVYDGGSIDWYKEHFFGGVELFLENEKIEMLKNMPISPRLGKYLQVLARGGNG